MKIQIIKIQVYPVSSTQVWWFLTVTSRARVDLEKKSLLSPWVTTALWSEEGHAPALGWVWGERENAGGRRGECYGALGRSIDVKQKFPLGPWCSVVFLFTVLARMSSSLFCSVYPVLSKLIRMFLLKNIFSALGTAYFDWLLSSERDKSFSMHFKLYSFMHFIHFCSSGKEVTFYQSPAENIVVLTAKNRRNIFHFQTVFLISFHILLWQWKLEKDKSKINNN